MTYPKSIKDRELGKFIDSPGRPNGVAVETINGESEKLIKVDSTSTPNTCYVGYAEIGALSSDAVWRIMQVVTASGDVETSYANGSSDYENIWDNRTGLSYS